MLVSNDDTWDIKITLQHVTYDHGSKRLLAKKLGQKHQPKVGQKIVSIVLDLFKSTCPIKLRSFFTVVTLCTF
jgi:hypothetical protein